MRAQTLVQVVAFILICGSITTLMKTVNRTFFRSSEATQQSVATTTQFPSAADPSNPSRLALSIPPATSAIDQHWQAMKLLTEASVAQRESLAHVEQWNTEIESLRNGESGDVIAVNRKLVEKLAYLFKKKRLTASEINVLGEQIALLQERVKTLAEKSPPDSLSPREMYEIRELDTKALTARRDWVVDLNQAEAIIRKAFRDANPITEPTLQQSLEQIETDTTLEQLDETIAKGDSAVTEVYPIEETTNPQDAELRKQALSAEVTSALAPFLEPRTIQPSLAGRFSIRFSRTSQSAPMSLGKLMSIGALNESELGLKKLALIGGNRKLPEPKWSIASQPNSWSEGDEEFLRNTQQMLRDYGAILVDEGLLSR